MRTTVVLFLWAGYPSCYSTSGVRALQIEDCRKHEALAWLHPFCVRCRDNARDVAA